MGRRDLSVLGRGAVDHVPKDAVCVDADWCIWILRRPQRVRVGHDLPVGSGDEATDARGARLCVRGPDAQACVLPAHEGAAVLRKTLHTQEQVGLSRAALSLRGIYGGRPRARVGTEAEGAGRVQRLRREAGCVKSFKCLYLSPRILFLESAMTQHLIAYSIHDLSSCSFILVISVLLTKDNEVVILAMGLSHELPQKFVQ